MCVGFCIAGGSCVQCVQVLYNELELYILCGCGSVYQVGVCGGVSNVCVFYIMGGINEHGKSQV